MQRSHALMSSPNIRELINGRIQLNTEGLKRKLKQELQAIFYDMDVIDVIDA
jgi:hypothetical protein